MENYLKNPLWNNEVVSYLFDIFPQNLTRLKPEDKQKIRTYQHQKWEILGISVKSTKGYGVPKIFNRDGYLAESEKNNSDYAFYQFPTEKFRQKFKKEIIARSDAAISEKDIKEFLAWVLRGRPMRI